MDTGIKLKKNFTTAFNKMCEKYGEEFEKLNGLSASSLNFTDFIDNFVDANNVADASIDSNANVSQKNVVSLIKEMSKPQQALLALNKIHYEMQKKYGFKTANDWFENQWNKALFMHDLFTSTFFPYCFAHDLVDLAEKGLFFLGNFNVSPPKHLLTFMDFVREFISTVSSSTSGACGLPNLIPYMYYFWDRDVKQGYYLRDPETYARQAIQVFMYFINQPATRDNLQSAFVNTSIFDHPYLEALFGGSVFPDGSPMIDEIDGIMHFQKLFLEVMSETRALNMMTFPVNSISLLYQDGKFVDEDFARYASQHNMRWGDSNIFIDDKVTSLANCCRLRSNIDDLYFNSIGGTALKVGSVKVSTVNLARLALQYNNEQEYLVHLREITELNLKALDVVRGILKRNVEKGLLPIFTHGVMDFKYLFSTVGVIGCFEAMKSFGYVKVDELGNHYLSPEADAFGKKIFDVMHKTIDLFALDKDYSINLEQIPAENCAIKFLRADSLLYPDTVVNDLPLYGNQFMPLGVQATLTERIRVAALFDGYLNGGSICHINIDAPFKNVDMAWDMLNYVASKGVKYFAFNTKIQACQKNHAFYGDVCPLCGGASVAEYTRIIGYFTRINSWSKDRREEYKYRIWKDVNTDGAAQ